MRKKLILCENQRNLKIRWYSGLRMASVRNVSVTYLEKLGCLLLYFVSGDIMLSLSNAYSMVRMDL